MADYSRHATPAPEWVEFQKTLQSPAPPGATVSEARDAINAARVKLHGEFYGVADDVQIDKFSISTPDGSSIPARLYRPKKTIQSLSSQPLLPLYIRLHSGGWHLGTLETEEPYCAHLCSTFTKADPKGVGIAVLNPLYRHTPEFAFPTQPNDAWAAFELFASEDSGRAAEYGIDATKIYLGGTSAGGNLSIGVAVREMRRVQRQQQQQQQQLNNSRKPTSRVKGLILTSPPTVHPDLFPYHLLSDPNSASYIQNATAPLLPASRMTGFYDMYTPSASSATKKDEQLSPLLIPDESFDADLWPPTAFHVAGMDPLRDEALLFEEKLRRVGKGGLETRVKVYGGFPHGFNMYPQLEESKKWREGKMEDLRWLVGREDGVVRS